MRLQGIWEHYNRIHFFLEVAKRQDEEGKFRLHLAAIVSAVAIIEITDELLIVSNVTKETFDFHSNCKNSIPYLDLIYRIRVHDFHRFGIKHHPPGVDFSAFQGPITLTAQKGHAGISMGDTLTSFKSGNASVKENRPLYRQNNYFLDQETNNFVSLENIMEGFQKSIKERIIEVERFLENVSKVKDVDHHSN